MKKIRKSIMTALVMILVLYFFLYWLQTSWGHRNTKKVLDYSQTPISESSGYEILFLQTGLGKRAIDKLLAGNDFGVILDIQEKFWIKSKIVCKPVFGLYSRVDKVDKDKTPALVDLRPGDILITLSTHSVGWHHGHAGLVLDEKRVLECVKWGEKSEIVKVSHWKTYSNYVVLRVKDASMEVAREVAEYAEKNLCGVPYRLTVGMFGEKNLDVDKRTFGTHCGHCVWYAWQQFGYDLDSNGGRIVTPYEVMMSKNVEVVQVYGLNPKIFM